VKERAFNLLYNFISKLLSSTSTDVAVGKLEAEKSVTSD
jgi:hypothetical protein